MDVLLARPRGFCAGVKRAISTVNRALELYGAPVYVLHEIVHNTHVISELAGKGAIFVERLEDVPSGSVTIFSAHGVSLAVMKQAVRLGLRTINATCPLVAKVHRRVISLNKLSCDVVVVGHKGHPEVEGTCGHATGAVHVVSTPEEVETLVVTNPAKVGCVTQTTLSVDDTSEIMAAIRRRFPDIIEPDRTDICFATTNRQKAVRSLADRSDLLLVVGSKNSSNSNRLREVARKKGIPAHLVDDAGEIDPTWLTNAKHVGVTAGASAPEHLVAEVADWLLARGASSVAEMDGEDESVAFQPPGMNV